MSAPGGAPRTDESALQRQQREVELHRTVSKHYDVRLERPFAQLYQQHWNEQLFALIPAGARAALDCGCGTGIMLRELAARFERVAGVDISPDMLARVPADLAGRCELSCGAVETMTFETPFDVIFCRSILHHVGDFDAALQRIHAALRPGGSVILSEPCADSLLLRLPRWLWANFSSRFDPDHRALRSRWLRERFEANGFRIVVLRKFGFMAFPLCGLSDLLPVMRWLPGACTLTRMLCAFDGLCSKIPLVRNESWHVIIRAERVD